MEKNNKEEYKIVETYTEDIAKVLEDDRGGLVKKIIHEAEEHETKKKKLSPESTKNKFFMIAGLLFIVIGLISLFYFILDRRAPTVPIAEQFVPLIFNDTGSSVEVAGLNRDEIIQTVSNLASASEVKAGGVEGIYLVNNKQAVGLREFLTLAGSNFVPPGNPILVSDNFLMGVVNSGTNPARNASGIADAGGDFFILLKMRSMTDIFDSLRAWEDKMFLDLHEFFGLAISSETNYLLTKDFEDGIVGNKNARVLYGREGQIVMMYIFANNHSTIITNTTDAAQEIMLRLASSQIEQ